MATNNVVLSEFLQFMQDLPFAQIGTAATAGGTNIMVDVAAAEGIVAAALKDFIGGSTTTAAPATTAAISNAVANPSGAIGS